MSIPIGGSLDEVRGLIARKFSMRSTNLVFVDVKSFNNDYLMNGAHSTRVLNEDICVLEMNDLDANSSSINVIAMNVYQGEVGGAVVAVWSAPLCKPQGARPCDHRWL